MNNLYEISPLNFTETQEIFSGHKLHLLVASTLAGHTPGQIIANHPEHPTTAALWNQMDSLFLAGTPTLDFCTEFGALFNRELIPPAQALGVPAGLIYLDHPRWIEFLPLITGNKTTAIDQRYAYSFNQLPNSTAQTLPTGFQLTPITPELRSWQTMQNFQDCWGWIHSFWRNLEEFSEHGAGYLIHTPTAIACWCFSVYQADTQYELGLATAPEFRGQGLASACATACLEKILSIGGIPLWQCETDNTPSIRLAEKLGFTLHQTYEVFRLPFA